MKRRSGRYKVKVSRSTSVLPATTSVTLMASDPLSPATSSFLCIPSSLSSASSSAAVVIERKRYLNASPPKVSDPHVTDERSGLYPARTTRSEACPLRADDDRRAMGVASKSMSSLRSRQRKTTSASSQRDNGIDNDKDFACFCCDETGGRCRKPISAAGQRAPAADAMDTVRQRPLATSISSRREADAISSGKLTTCQCQRAAPASRKLTSQFAAGQSNNNPMTSCDDKSNNSCSCHVTDQRRVRQIRRRNCGTQTKPVSDSCYTTSGVSRTPANEASDTLIGELVTSSFLLLNGRLVKMVSVFGFVA